MLSFEFLKRLHYKEQNMGKRTGRRRLAASGIGALRGTSCPLRVGHPPRNQMLSLLRICGAPFDSTAVIFIPSELKWRRVESNH